MPLEEIVKGYEYKKGQFVLIENEELQSAAATSSRTMDILGFVDAHEIDPLYFEKPYYLGTSEAGQRPYALLREALKRTGRVGIARIVLRTREHLAAILVKENVLMLELLRYEKEIRSAEELEVPDEEVELSIQEVRMAERLIENMTMEWDPGQFHDEFSETLLRMIEEKAERGHIEEVKSVPPREVREEQDLMALLQESLTSTEEVEIRDAESSDGHGFDENEPLRH